jgi:hypothetical protein
MLHHALPPQGSPALCHCSQRQPGRLGELWFHCPAQQCMFPEHLCTHRHNLFFGQCVLLLLPGPWQLPVLHLFLSLILSHIRARYVIVAISFKILDGLRRRRYIQAG